MCLNGTFFSPLFVNAIRATLCVQNGNKNESRDARRGTILLWDENLIRRPRAHLRFLFRSIGKWIIHICECIACRRWPSRLLLPVSCDCANPSHLYTHTPNAEKKRNDIRSAFCHAVFVAVFGVVAPSIDAFQFFFPSTFINWRDSNAIEKLVTIKFNFENYKL